MTTKAPQILLTNDDGIDSPGIKAAAAALDELGEVTIAAPRQQSSGAGRALFLGAEGKIYTRSVDINGKTWKGYAIDGSPAQTVIQAMLEIMPTRPDLVVSGINYGENLGNVITASGTVGAAIEAVSMGVPAIAVSLQLCENLWLTHDSSVDFTVAAYFTLHFARWILKHKLPPEVDLLKIDVPNDAQKDTPWRLTRLAHHRYWQPFIDRQNGWEGAARLDGRINVEADQVSADSDVRALKFDGLVSVTPLSIDLTSRVDFSQFEQEIREDK